VGNGLKDRPVIGWAAVAEASGNHAFVLVRAAPHRDSSMALTADAIHLSPSLSATDPAADAALAEGLSALESYKKKDPTKGSDAYMAWHRTPVPRPSRN
jgi:hypothetical protein